MRVWFRRPSGELRCYEADTDSHMDAIEMVRQHDAEAGLTTCLAVIDGGKAQRAELLKEPA